MTSRRLYSIRYTTRTLRERDRELYTHTTIQRCTVASEKYLHRTLCLLLYDILYYICNTYTLPYRIRILVVQLQKSHISAQLTVYLQPSIRTLTSSLGGRNARPTPNTAPAAAFATHITQVLAARKRAAVRITKSETLG